MPAEDGASAKEKADLNVHDLSTNGASPEAGFEVPISQRKVKWCHSTLYNAMVLGLCNFLSPGIWAAINSLGGGGEEKPYLVNNANAILFGVMTPACFLSPVVMQYISIRLALLIGTLGFAPYAAGLYLSNEYGVNWLLLLGAALCGLSAGLFWMAQIAVAMSYPEPYNQGRFVGLWLSFCVGGQILGGAISLGINAHRDQAGKVSSAVFLCFIGLQAVAPFSSLLLDLPHQVQRSDGVKVRLAMPPGTLAELRRTSRLLFSVEFLCMAPMIAAVYYSEAVFFTFVTFFFTVRARALGSFLSGAVAAVSGYLLGAYLDMQSIKMHTRSRVAYVLVMVSLGASWVWMTVLVHDFEKRRPIYDWNEGGFYSPFLAFLVQIITFQFGVVYLTFIANYIARTQAEVIRVAALVRTVASALQALSYGIGSIKIMALAGNIYINFGLWGLAVIPGWLVIRSFGVQEDRKMSREAPDAGEEHL